MKDTWLLLPQQIDYFRSKKCSAERYTLSEQTTENVPTKKSVEAGSLLRSNTKIKRLVQINYPVSDYPVSDPVTNVYT